MGLKRLTVSALAAVLAMSGIGSILVMQHQPAGVDAVELEPAIRRQDDDGPSLQVVDDAEGDGDDTTGDDGTNGGANTGDGDNTGGNDGTSGGNNTGDGDSTAGNDGTGGGNNTADNSDTGGGDTSN